MTEEFNTTSNDGEGLHAPDVCASGEQVQSSDSSKTASQSNHDANVAARRRLLRAGLIAGPLLVTLRGRPARAQLPSLGSAEIFYGAYVTDDQIQQGQFDADDLGKALNSNGEILDDPSRRSGN